MVEKGLIINIPFILHFFILVYVLILHIITSFLNHLENSLYITIPFMKVKFPFNICRALALSISDMIRYIKAYFSILYFFYTLLPLILVRNAESKNYLPIIFFLILIICSISVLLTVCCTFLIMFQKIIYERMITSIDCFITFSR